MLLYSQVREGGCCTGPHSKTKYRFWPLSSCTGPSFLGHVKTCSTWTSLYRDIPRHVQTCSTWTSLYRDPPPRHVQTCSTWTSLYRDIPRHVETCSTWTSLYRNNQDMFKLVQLGSHCTGTTKTCSNLFNFGLTVQPTSTC